MVFQLLELLLDQVDLVLIIQVDLVKVRQLHLVLFVLLLVEMVLTKASNMVVV